MPASEVGGTRVVGILQTAVELGGETLERSRLLLDRSGQPARDRVDENHRRKIAVREDVGPDRDRVGREMLQTLAERKFPVDEIIALASERSSSYERNRAAFGRATEAAAEGATACASSTSFPKASPFRSWSSSA